jgi:hypothetical protein
VCVSDSYRFVSNTNTTNLICPVGSTDTNNGTPTPCLLTSPPNGCNNSSTNPPACDNNDLKKLLGG